MTAPQIPNLLSMRGRGLGRRRGRSAAGRGDAGPSDESPELAAARHDQIIQQTDTDANLSRLSAVEAGYISDPFAAELAPSRASEPGSSRRMPIINRGTYARTFAVDRLVDSFIGSSPEQKRQIISLGAGSDTRFFRIISHGQGIPNVLYHELDFPSNTAQKVAMIKKSTKLKGLFGEKGDYTETETEFHSSQYHLHAIDLRTLSPSDNSSPDAGNLSHIDPDLPTLILSECCLTYLKPDAADAVVKYFAHTALKPETPVGLVLYEPINPFDAFGKVMISNLAARGIVLQTVQKYNSLDTQIARLKSYGLEDGQGAVDADFLHEQWIDAPSREVLNGIEMLDEVEELKMLLKHYCVAWGWRNGKDASVWDEWQKTESQPLKP